MAEEKKTDTIEQKLTKAHSDLLDGIKEVYPLAVLGSLCIAISAFTKDTYPQAQIFAIAAASLFLIAFVSSLAQKFMPSGFYAFISIASIAIGTVFLFLVVMEFAMTISLVGKALLIVSFLFIMAIMFSLMIIILRNVRKTKSKLVVICGTIAAGTVCLFLLSITLPLAYELTGNSIFPKFNSGFMNMASIMVVMFATITIFLIDKEGKKEKAKTPMVSEGP